MEELDEIIEEWETNDIALTFYDKFPDDLSRTVKRMYAFIAEYSHIYYSNKFPDEIPVSTLVYVCYPRTSGIGSHGNAQYNMSRIELFEEGKGNVQGTGFNYFFIESTEQREYHLEQTRKSLMEMGYYLKVRDLLQGKITIS